MYQTGRALILEDGRTAPVRISGALEAMDFEAATAGGGREALLKFTPHHLDIVFSETAGPGTDGTSVLESRIIDLERSSPGKGFLWGGVISLTLWVVLGVLLANLLL